MAMYQPALSSTDADALHEKWQRQQEPFLAHRAQAFSALAAAVATDDTTRPPRVLDLAGGTGGVADAVANAATATEIVLADADPVLLAIAAARRSIDVTVHADLRSPSWVAALPNTDFDAVVVGNALHCFPARRLRAIYREVARVLRPGGVFAIAELMPDAGLAALADSAQQAWSDWWAQALAHPALAVAAAERARQAPDSADFYASVAWHRVALHSAGFTGISIRWRRDNSVVLSATSPSASTGTSITSGRRAVVPLGARHVT